MLENENFLFKETKVRDTKTKALRFVMSLYNPEFKKVKELDEIEMFNPFGEKIKGTYFHICYSFSRDKIFTGNQEREYEIYVYDFDGNLVRKIKKEYKPIPPWEEYKQEFIKMPGKFYEMIKNKLYFPDNLPPFHDFLTDEDGRIYVMTYEKGKNPQEYVFDIFSPEGIFIARKSLKVSSLSGGLHGKFRNNRLYFVYEKASGFQKLVGYKITWK